ncbi:MAG: hypothetical protein ACOYMV_06760 [Verrucomicrobiia bacterium]
MEKKRGADFSRRGAGAQRVPKEPNQNCPRSNTERREKRAEYARQPELSLSVFGLPSPGGGSETPSKGADEESDFFDRIYRITGIEEGSALGETEAFDGKRVRAFGKRLMVS